MNSGRRAATALALIALVAIFVALGFWQLDRAAQLRKSQAPYQELPIIALSDVTKPNINLPGEAINRIVLFSGTYVAQLDAPGQRDRAGRVATWSVGVMEVDGGGNILVVRSASPAELPRGDIEVTGRLFHRQFEDVSAASSGELRRIDPAIVVADYGGSFFDGYVVATQELAAGQVIEVDRIALDPALPTTPGNYWQHIAYVVIWWLMAVVVLFLPFYSRWRSREVQ